MFFDSDLDSIRDRIFATYAALVGVWADTLTGAQIRALLPVGVLHALDADADADARTIVGVADAAGIDASDLVEAIYGPGDWFMEQIGHPDAYAR
jgi:hypothetical protein